MQVLILIYNADHKKLRSQRKILVDLGNLDHDASWLRFKIRRLRYELYLRRCGYVRLALRDELLNIMKLNAHKY